MNEMEPADSAQSYSKAKTEDLASRKGENRTERTSTGSGAGGTGSLNSFKKPDINPNVPVINLTPSSHSTMYGEDGSSEGPFGSSGSTMTPDLELPEVNTPV
jgi:hypothetical protein